MPIGVQGVRPALGSACAPILTRRIVPAYYLASRVIEGVDERDQRDAGLSGDTPVQGAPTPDGGSAQPPRAASWSGVTLAPACAGRRRFPNTACRGHGGGHLDDRQGGAADGTGRPGAAVPRRRRYPDLARLPDRARTSAA